MIIYQLTFSGPALDEDDKFSFLDEVDTLFNCLYKQNQICTRGVIVNFGPDGIKAIIDCPEEQVIFSKENNFYPQKYINRIKENYNLEISIEKIGENPLTMGGSYATSTAFILYGDGDGLSPLRSFNDFKQIPLYEFPYTYSNDPTYHDINGWQKDYEDLISLWFSGRVNEAYCFEMLSSMTSPVTVSGFEICRRIESLTGKDCYYYLFNYESKVNDDACPSCGGEWQLEEKMFDEFDLRCDQCKIVSKKGLYE